MYYKKPSKKQTNMYYSYTYTIPEKVNDQRRKLRRPAVRSFIPYPAAHMDFIKQQQQQKNHPTNIVLKVQLTLQIDKQKQIESSFSVYNSSTYTFTYIGKNGNGRTYRYSIYFTISSYD